MKELDFKPAKSKNEFRSNYKLHDLASKVGFNLFVQWGIEFENFGEDRRFEKLWEKGEDKPDIILTINGKTALLDWKGKRTHKFLVNERAIKSYESWKKKLNHPVLIGFLIFDSKNTLVDRRIAKIGKHNYMVSEDIQWDKNKTIEFIDELPILNKENIIELMV